MPTMARQKALRFPFPLGGVDRHWSHRKQPIMTAPDALNVRTFETIEGRARGGQRPGTRKVYQEQVGGASAAVRCLAQVSHAKSGDSYTGTDEDNFTRDNTTVDLGDGWTTSTWFALSHWILNNQCYSSQKTDYANVRTELTGADFSDAVEYVIRADVVMNAGSGVSSWKHIYAKLDDSVPDIAVDGLDCALHIYGSGGTIRYVGWIKAFKAGVLNATYTIADAEYQDHGGNFTAQLSLAITGNNIIFKIDDTTLITQSVVALSGKRCGLGTERRGSDPLFFDNWLVTGTKVTGAALPKETRLVAIGNGELWAEAAVGVMSEVTGTLADFSTDHPIMAQEQGQKLYIADYATEKVTGTDGTIGGAGDNELTATGVADWTALSIDADNDLVTLSDSSGPTDGVYGIASIVTAKLTLDTSAGSGGSCTYRVERAPKIYDPGLDAVSLYVASVGKGYIPVGCQLIALYRNRVVLARHTTDLKNWYMSRQDDPIDWDYGQTDEQAAVAGHNADAGKLGQPCTALIPFSDDYLVFGCDNSVWLLRGDPLAGGMIDNITFETGVLGGQAWCQDSMGILYFMGNAGLYRMEPNGKPINISAGNLPSDLQSVNMETYNVYLLYDHLAAGIHIYITKKEAGTSQHWYYDIRAKAFWPEQQPSDHGPTAVISYQADNVTYRKLLFGGRDGYLRGYDSNMSTDDGTAITSHVTFAPQRAIDDLTEGLISTVEATLGTNTTGLDWQIRTGDSHEQAVDATAAASGKWTTGGRQKPIRPRLRCGSVAVRLSSDAEDEVWAYENMIARVTPAGRVRF